MNRNPYSPDPDFQKPPAHWPSRLLLVRHGESAGDGRADPRCGRAGITEFFPEQAEFRKLLGKFYHRPPGGESWCDVILRLRSVVDTLSLHYPGHRVLIVSHEVVVLCLRYLLEELDEERILAIEQQGDVANCAVTEYEYQERPASDGALVLQRFNETAPLQQQGAPVTSAPDVPVAAK